MNNALKDLVAFRLQEMARRADELSEDYSEFEGLPGVKVTIRLDSFEAYRLDCLAKFFDMSRTKTAGVLLEAAIRDAIFESELGDAKNPRLEIVREWALKNVPGDFKSASNDSNEAQ